MSKLARIALRIALPLAAAALGAGCSNDYSVYALTSTGQIIQFNTTSPSSLSSSVDITGLNSGQSVVQLSYQPSSGTLYCITNDGYLCTVSPTTGAATLISTTPFTENLGSGDDTVTLSDPAASFDPVGGDVRVFANGYNLLVNADGALDAGVGTEPTDVASYASGDVNSGKTPQLVGIAYTNALSGATETTLYGLDSATDSLVQIGGSDEPNIDSVDTGSLKTVGALGIAISTNTGFAIDSASNTGYASLQDGSGATLYSVDLSNGVLTDLGAIGDGTETVISLVIAPTVSSTSSGTTLE